jgi:hypothetical protein
MLVAESPREFLFQRTANSLGNSGSCCMRCYFIRDAQVVGVAMLPSGLSDQYAIARAHKLSARRKGRIDGFEVWDGARLVSRHSARSLAFSG